MKISPPRKNIRGICHICNREFKSQCTLSFHLHKEHNIILKNYLKENGLWPKCKRKSCNKFSYKHCGGYCSRSCNNKDNKRHQKHQE